MTRKEAMAVNQVLLAVISQKRLLKIVGLELGTDLDEAHLDAATLLADRAHIALGVGVDPSSMRRAWRDPENWITHLMIGERSHDSQLERI